MDNIIMDRSYKNIRWIALTMFINRCHCCCKHCKGRGDSPVAEYHSQVSYPEAEAVIRNFDRWRKDGHNHIRITFNQMEIWDFPGVEDRIRLGKEIYGFYGPVVCNGMRFMNDTELADYMHRVHMAGAKEVVTTFYGMREFHDEFSGRPGDFDYTTRVAIAAANEGLKCTHVLFFGKSMVSYLEPLHKHLSSLPGQHRFQHRCILSSPLAPTGSEEWLTKAEYDALPDEYKGHGTFRMATRKEWNEYIRAGRLRDDTKELNNLYLILRIGSKKFDPYYTMSMEDFLDQIITLETEKRLRTPTMYELMEMYGQDEIDSDLMYCLSDIQVDWKLKYLRDNPHVKDIHYLAII